MTRKWSCVVREEADGAGPAMVPRQRPTSLTMYKEKALNPVQTGLPGLSAMYHYIKFDMASRSMNKAGETPETLNGAVVLFNASFIGKRRTQFV
jgi:hypothetical protein